MLTNAQNAPIIIGLDPSLTGFGVCVLTKLPTGWDPQFLRITSKPNKECGVLLCNRFIRYKMILNQLHSFLPFQDVLGVFVEGYSYGSHGRSVVSLGEFGGLLRRYLLSEYGPNVWEISPKSVKSFVCANGNSTSAELAQKIHKDYGISLEYSEDEFVGYGLAKVGAAFLGLDAITEKHQLRAIEAVKKGMLPKEKKVRKKRKVKQ